MNFQQITSEQPPTPKYWQLAQYFRRQMQEGVLKPGDRLPSLTAMRDLHQASRPTVEKAHALLLRDGLIERQQGAGVFVAQPRRRAAAGVIGLSGKGFHFNGYSPYWAGLMGGVREAAAAGSQLLILDTESHHGWEKADGVLVCDWASNRALRHCPPGMPAVSLLTPVEGVASVAADDYTGARDATAALLALGHRRIAYLHGYPQPLVTQRLAGYRDALTAADIASDPSWQRGLRGTYLYGPRFTEVARRHMLLWLRDSWRDTRCTAILCHNDETALGVVQALREKGFTVPRDVSVVGFDGTEYCDIVSPSLSSVEVPLRAIGAAGVELLLQQIDSDTSVREHRILTPRFKARASTAGVI